MIARCCGFSLSDHSSGRQLIESSGFLFQDLLRLSKGNQSNTIFVNFHFTDVAYLEKMK